MHRIRTLGLIAAIALLTVVAGILGETPAQAATSRTWTGATGGNWSTPGNWSPSGTPQSGDTLVFSNVTPMTVNNDIVELTVASLTLNTSFVKITGNRLGISSSLSAPATNGDPELDLVVILRGEVAVTLGSGTRLFMRERLSPVGTVALDMNGHTLARSGGSDMEFDGDIIGNGTIVTGGQNMSIETPITFGGTISVNSGTELVIGEIGLPGDFCGSAPNTRFILNNATLTATCQITIGSVTGTGRLGVFDSVSSISIKGRNGAVFDGEVEGDPAGAFNCCSAGNQQTLRGVSTFKGPVNVDHGTLAFDGAAFPSASQFTVTTSGVLKGYGSFGDTIMTNSKLDLGQVSGNFGFAKFPTLQFAPDVVVSFRFQGATPGSGFSQIQMTGQIVLDHALLDLNFDGFTPAVGQSLTLIKGATALLDTFHNLPEGSTFLLDGKRYKITYKGGAGNDVIITRLSDPATPSPTVGAAKRYLPQVARDEP